MEVPWLPFYVTGPRNIRFEIRSQTLHPRDQLCAPVSFLRKVQRVSSPTNSAVPKRLPSNPGKGSAGSTTFVNAEKSWVEHFNLVSLLASVLGQLGHPVRSEEGWLVHENSGLTLLPEVTEVQPLDGGGVRTTTTIQTSHSALVPEGVFEYQHSTGNNLDESFRKGFDQWATTDLTALLEALLPRPEICTTLEMEFPEKEGRPAYSRRAVLGPVTHFVQNPQVAAEPRAPAHEGEIHGEHCGGHEFCPCCLLTNSFETFRDLIESSGFYGLRLLAMRDERGSPQADCRVNGTDWDKGAEALRRYVATWPAAGFEMRKQYVVLQTINKELLPMVPAVTGGLHST